MTGKFITLEGPDGAGKSTQARILLERLRAEGHKAILTREPGGTKLAEEIRRLLLDPQMQGMAPEAEALLYAAARAQHVREVITLALAAGQIVVCDRFADSSIAYQGYGRGLEPTAVREANKLATGGLVPNLTIILDLEVTTGLERIKEQRAQQVGAPALDRLELEQHDFHQRVREGFLALAHEFPDRIKVVQATGKIQDVSFAVWTLVAKLLGSNKS